METPYIPRKTLEELNSSHSEGSRHAAIIKIAMSLLGNRLPAAAVFATIRPQFDAEKTDKEIWDVIDWCSAQNPQPSVPMNGASRSQIETRHPNRAASRPVAPPKKSKDELESGAATLALDFIDGDKIGIDETVSRSKVAIGEPGTHAETLLTSLYSPQDQLNVVCAFTVNENGKANPQGGGKTLPRDEWVQWFRGKGTPKSEAGAWIRPNPCGPGTGSGGAIKDDDILNHAFMLIESDFLPLDVQLALYAKWNLPVAAIILSGGDSAHAWIRLNAPNGEDYRVLVQRILEAVKPFGFDQSNKNPSRLSRLAGAKRTIGASGDGIQRLLYLNPEARPATHETVDEFERQVAPPFSSRYPLRKTARASIDRYEELHKNKGATGLRTGLATFDRKTGGLKRGQLIVLAAQTNAGKSSLAMNIVSQALRDNRTVALFTLEMDRDEIYDMLMAMNFTVNRNVFNTGNFSEADMARILHGGGKLEKMPLHIFDDPIMTCEQISEACSKLKESGGIDLVVVDYLQLVSVISRDSREQQVAQIGRSLRALAKTCKVPVIAVSQLNEDGKIRESRAVAHDAHIVFMLEWDDAALKLRITKGRSVMKEDYEMYFDAIHCKMGEANPIKEEDVPRYGGNQ